MRIQLFWSFYDEFLTQIYRAQPSLRERAYAEQVAAILGDRFGWVPSVVLQLAAQGHEVDVIVVNAHEAQRAWARENGIDFREHDWQQGIPLEQVQRFAPDVLLIGSMFRYYGPYLQQLRQWARRVCAWIAVPVPPFVELGGIDLILTSHEHFRQKFLAAGHACERMLPSFDAVNLQQLPQSVRDIPVSFVGSFTWGHRNRIALMRELSGQLPLQLWASFPSLRWRSLARPAEVLAYLESSTLRKVAHAPVFGRHMYAVLARSRIGLNIHLEAAGGLAGNMRMFEVTGMGAALLTEWMPNLPELFDPATEVCAYRSPKELVEIAKQLIADEALCASVARAGQVRTLSDHSPQRRAGQLSQLLEQVVHAA